MIAFTFPGQGAQRPGMGLPWVGHQAWDLVERASDAAGRDVARLLLEADAEELKDTRHAQLTTFVLSQVVLGAVRATGVDAAYVAGHSLGEYTALTATGALGFDDGVRLVVARGDAMHAAGSARQGTMAAVLGLDDALVEEACARAATDVWVANYNAPGQVVIAGSPAGLDAASLEAKALGAKKVMPLSVSGAFHTPFMAAARERLQVAIGQARLADAAVPVVTNVDARPHRLAGEWSDLLAAQLTGAVRWAQCLQTLHALGVGTFVEVGPGAALTGMAKRAVDGTRTTSVATPDEVERVVTLAHAQEPVGSARTA